MNKTIYFLRGLFVIILLTGFSKSTLAQLSGSGTSSDPYLISTLTDLEYLSATSSLWGSYFKQTADIDASATSGWNSGQGFSPIGNSTTKFIGNYDGNGYTITGLYISRSATDYIGLFGFTNTGGAINNVNLISENITGYDYVGGLVGYNNLTPISDSYSAGSVSGNSRVGGLVGDSFNSTISNSYSTANINGTNIYIGGLVGVNDGSSTISNSYSTGTVTGTDNYVGGLAGESYYATISKSYSTGSISGGSYLGGLVGYSYASTLDNCYSTGSVSGVSAIGGLIGKNNTGTTISNSYATGSVSGTGSLIGGLVGWNVSTVTASFWDTQTSGQTTSAAGTGKTTANMKTYTTFLNAGWSPSIWYMDASINNGYPYLSWQNPSGTPLPVELTSFTAVPVDKGVLLNWQTATEVDNYGFEIDRAIDNGQLTMDNWDKIGFVNGHGNSNSPNDYSFTDNSVAAGKYSYRLKQIDTDGQFEYSDVVNITVGTPKKFELSQNYPNPFNPATIISYSIPKGTFVKINVYNILGERVAQLVNGRKEAGEYKVHFDASKLKSGIYVYQITAGSFTQVRKMILLK